MSGDRQFRLGFEPQISLSDDNFLVADGNRAAVLWLSRWPDWPGPALVITGPRGCGKTHLANLFVARTNGCLLTAERLDGGDAFEWVGAAPVCIVDDAEAFIEGDRETAFLHLYNVLAETGRRMMLTARRPPSRWSVALPDLRSRLNAATIVAIAPPNDEMMRAVLVKLFADRQLRVDEAVIDYMITRMERSFDVAQRLVAALDEASLNARRNITVPLVREVLAAPNDPPESDPA